MRRRVPLRCSVGFPSAADRCLTTPQFALIQGSLNKPCIALPAKANLGSLVGLVPVAVQDINILSSPQNQQCTENSTQAKGDEALSHLLNDIPILSGNGAGNN